MILALLGLVAVMLWRVDRSVAAMTAELRDHNRWISALYANSGTSERSRYRITLNSSREDFDA